MESTPDNFSLSRIAIIGAGAVGGYFAHRCRDAGHSIELILNRSRDAARELACELGAEAHTWSSLKSLSGIDLIIITVPDDQIEPVAEKLSAFGINKGALIFHCSGLKSRSELEILAGETRELAAIHPLRSITKGQRLAIDKELVCGVEADPKSSATLLVFLKSINVSPIWLKSEAKGRYHLVASVLSNFSVALHGFAADMLVDLQKEGSNIELHHFGDLVTGSLENVRELGPSDALTGPIVRADTGTIRSHLEILQKGNPDHLDVYLALAKLSLNTAKERGSFGEDSYDEIKELLIEYGSARE